MTMSIKEMKKRPYYFDDGFSENSLGGRFEKFASERPLLTIFGAIGFNLVVAAIIAFIFFALN